MNDDDLDRRLRERGAGFRDALKVPEPALATSAVPLRRRTWPKVAAAAAVVLIVPVAVLLVRQQDGPARTAGGGPEPTSIPATYEVDGTTLYLAETTAWTNAYTPRGEPATVILSAGSDSGEATDCAPLTVAFVTEQTATSVTIVTASYKPTKGEQSVLACPAVGYPAYRLTVSLDQPLGDRTALDDTGTEHPVLDASTVLTPTYIPAGYTGPTLTWNEINSSTKLTYAGQEQARLTVSAQSPAVPASPPYKRENVATDTVQGSAATVWKSDGFDDLLCAEWIDKQNVQHQVCSSGSPTAPLDAATLLTVAKSLA